MRLYLRLFLATITEMVSKKAVIQQPTYNSTSIQAHRKMKENFYFSSIRREMQLFKNSFLFQIYQRKNYYKIQICRIKVCKIVAKNQTCKKIERCMDIFKYFFFLSKIKSKNWYLKLEKKLNQIVIVQRSKAT